MKRLRLIWLLLGCAGLLAACGWGSGASNRAKGSGGESAWLRIEVKPSRSGFAWYLNGKSTDTEGMKAALQEYAARKDRAAGLQGPDERHISPNPVIFACTPGAPSDTFIEMAELMMIAMLWRLRIELRTPSGNLRRAWVQLPTDSSLGGIGQEPGHLMMTSPVMKGKIPKRAHIQVRKKGELFRLWFGHSPEEMRPIEGAEFKETDLGDMAFDDSIYSRVRDALQRRIASIGKTGSDGVQDVAFHLPAHADEADHLTFAVLFLLMEAVSRANALGKGPPLGFCYGDLWGFTDLWACNPEED